MKQYMKLLPVLALGLAMGSCVDDATPKPIHTHWSMPTM